MPEDPDQMQQGLNPAPMRQRRRRASGLLREPAGRWARRARYSPVPMEERVVQDHAGAVKRVWTPEGRVREAMNSQEWIIYTHDLRSRMGLLEDSEVYDDKHWRRVFAGKEGLWSRLRSTMSSKTLGWWSRRKS